MVNPAAKYFLLDHAFATGANRVQFGVDALNARSRVAMRKLGATEESVLRRAQIAWTGRVFDRPQTAGQAGKQDRQGLGPLLPRSRHACERLEHWQFSARSGP